MKGSRNATSLSSSGDKSWKQTRKSMFTIS
jgi:hypothetical protein